MRTLLVLAPNPGFTEELRRGMNPEKYRMVERSTWEEAEPMLVHGLVDVCLIDVELTVVQGVWRFEKLRRRAPKCPIILFTGPGRWEWEEEAYLHGVAHVLSKPVRPRMLEALLERLGTGPTTSLTELCLPARQAEPPPASAHPGPAPLGGTPTLGVLRDFSGILTQSLNAEDMVKRFLIWLREALSVNRAAIFLRPSVAAFDDPHVGEASRQLRAAGSIGLSSGLLQHFELSLEAGIGGQLLRLGRILRRHGEEARGDPAALKEFELLGAQVAVPILDRETLLGVAVLDGRITGEPLVNAELELIFHLLEQLGLAIRNLWLHDQLAGNHQMMTGILRELSSGCVVVSRDLAILHANKMARKYFSRGDHRTGELEFSDLPPVVGAKVYQVLKTGSAIANFKFKPETPAGAIYSLNLVPFQRQQPGLPASVLLMVEDLTQDEQLQRLQVEAAGLRLVKTMAERLNHEISNALVPLSVHQQMLAEKLQKNSLDLEFLRVMERDLGHGVTRVSRLTTQMRFLAREALPVQEAFPLGPLLEEACQQAHAHQAGKAAQLRYGTASQPFVLNGDRSALRHALAEVILNALQASPADPKIEVHPHAEVIANGNGGAHALFIDVQDNGPGFTPEAVEKAASPFFTTRAVGLGLGLAVSRNIIESHRGKLEIVRPEGGRAGFVRISLPFNPPGGNGSDHEMARGA